MSVALHNEIMQRATAPVPVRWTAAPRKLIVAVTVILMLLVTTAAALTITELVREKMEPVKQIELDDQSSAWDQEEKLAIIALMLDWGFELDQEKLARLNDDLPQAEAELLTYQIIWDCIGERLQAYWRAQGLPTDQPEEFPLSSRTYALYEALWLMNDPAAAPDAIRVSYAEWETKLRAGNPEMPASALTEQERAAKRRAAETYMSEVIGMSQREQDAADLTVVYHDSLQLWQAILRVSVDFLREDTRRWFDSHLGALCSFDSAGKVYICSVLYDAEGLLHDYSVLSEQDWRILRRAAQEPERLEEELARAALEHTIDGYMADVMSMSTRERNAATWTAERNEAGTAWQVNISVKGSLLREETREWFHRQYLIGNTAYDQETDYYDYPYVFTAEGRSGDAATLEEYEWNNLIPREAWPEMPDAYADYPYFDPLKCFLYASAAEKAAFSQAWKPVVDAWLEEHPAYKDKLLAEGSNNYLYRITRHHYGTPPEKYIQQHEALRIAVMHSITLRPDVTVDQLMNRCHHILYYDLCDPDRPLWKVEVSWDAERMLSGDPVVDFLVIIDPRSGEVISDQRTLTLEDALRW